MSYVPGFTNDIFISFSHVDNWDGWVDKFQDHLSHRLAQLGVDVTIWRDSKLRGPDVFSNQIFQQLQQSALLISIISPRGIESRWCEDERQAFERYADLNGGFRVNNQLRAIKVVKTPLPADQHRPLFGVLGYEFYKREAQSNRFREFDPSSFEFKDLSSYLAQDIKSLLDDFCSYVEAAPRENTTPAPDKHINTTLQNETVSTALQKATVYVATTTPALKASRDIIVQQLNDWGYAVSPHDSEPPRRFASFQAVTRAELDASIFSVHLVSDQPQPILEGGQDSITGQYEFAQSLRKDRIIWVEPGRRLYSKFDDAFRNGLQTGVDILLDSSIEDLKDVIVEKLNQRRRVSAPARESEAVVELNSTYKRADPSLSEGVDGAQHAVRVTETVAQISTQDSRWAPRELFTIEKYRTLYDAAMNATTTATKGSALEDLAEYMFLCVPGLDRRGRNLQRLTEEIDLAFSNQGDGFWRDVGSPFIVECHNMSSPVSAQVIRYFVAKIRPKKIKTGFIVTTNLVTKDGQIEQRQALQEGTTVVSIDGQDLLRVQAGEDLLRVFEDRYFDCRLL